MMNTKIVMTASAFFLGICGVLFTFMPEEILNTVAVLVSPTLILFGQILGAMFFAFGVMNWMMRESSIGGIYHRPIVVANLTHFVIGSMSLLKELMAHRDHSAGVWIVAVIYTIFAIVFGLLLFRHPLAGQK